MKCNVYGMRLELLSARTNRLGKTIGKIQIFRERRFSLSEKTYLIDPARVARALEAQRLFLSQLEKATK